MMLMITRESEQEKDKKERKTISSNVLGDFNAPAGIKESERMHIPRILSEKRTIISELKPSGGFWQPCLPFDLVAVTGVYSFYIFPVALENFQYCVDMGNSRLLSGSTNNTASCADGTWSFLEEPPECIPVTTSVIMTTTTSRPLTESTTASTTSKAVAKTTTTPRPLTESTAVKYISTNFPKDIDCHITVAASTTPTSIAITTAVSQPLAESTGESTGSTRPTGSTGPTESTGPTPSTGSTVPSGSTVSTGSTGSSNDTMANSANSSATEVTGNNTGTGSWENSSSLQTNSCPRLRRSILSVSLFTSLNTLGRNLVHTSPPITSEWATGH
ncbi:mucin-5AC-like [Penaeus indicus]|uniref:mucin-5AC-like n=1 Tax=Penaeus indicus TaxID=29960 RepID=UPI00300D71BE